MGFLSDLCFANNGNFSFSSEGKNLLIRKSLGTFNAPDGITIQSADKTKRNDYVYFLGQEKKHFIPKITCNIRY